jgi:hypothetical protein
VNLFIYSLLVVIILLLLWWLSIQDKRIDVLTDKVNSLSKRKIIGVAGDFSGRVRLPVACRMLEEEWSKDEIPRIDIYI